MEVLGGEGQPGVQTAGQQQVLEVEEEKEVRCCYPSHRNCRGHPVHEREDGDGWQGWETESDR